MEHLDVMRLFDEQLKLDLGVIGDWPESPVEGHLISTGKPLPGSRYHGETSEFFRAVIEPSCAFIRCDMDILSEVEEIARLDRSEWTCQFKCLRKIDEMLQCHGYEVKNTHVYFLPQLDGDSMMKRAFAAAKLRNIAYVEVLERDQISHSDWAGRHFDNCVNPDGPRYAENMLLAVARNGDGEPIGCAGASADGEHLWQVGVDVLPGHQGFGIGRGVVSLITDEVLACGKVPYYGTAESHIASQKTALSSGYAPAFTEVFSKVAGL